MSDGIEIQKTEHGNICLERLSTGEYILEEIDEQAMRYRISKPFSTALGAVVAVDDLCIGCRAWEDWSEL